MNGIEIAALIAAIAFAGLMFFLIRLVQKANRVISNVEKTVEEANYTIQIVTKDADILSREVDGQIGRASCRERV